MIEEALMEGSIIGQFEICKYLIIQGARANITHTKCFKKIKQHKKNIQTVLRKMENHVLYEPKLTSIIFQF